ncbi:MAG: DUF177 domain-containing protein [Thermodesulfobacteriota bacterium]|nr:DUF177 domain-containing protein [Thermodesulfobacteriota bacterium]
METRLGKEEGGSIRLAGPLTLRLELAPAGSRIVVRGALRTAVHSACARCLEAFDFVVAENIFVVYAPEVEGREQEEMEAEAPGLEFFTGEEIDLWPVIAEHLVLGLPIKALCRKECLGLCPVCGKNLNLGPCRCDVRSGHPGLAGLKEIKNKLPK